MPRIILPLIALLSLAAFPLGAQTSLSARMQAFMREIEDEPNTEMAAFFPRRGDWTWVQTRGYNRGGRVAGVGIWRFPGAETVRAIGEGGPVCSSFDVGTGLGFGPYEGRFGVQARMHREPWRRVRGTRFVPAGESAASPVFVEWRREGGVWVVSAFGDLDVYDPPALGRPALRDPFSRDTVGVPADAAFAPADWYMITLNRLRYTKYGNPRPLNEADRARLARIGLYQGVSVFALREEADWPAHVYLLTAPGQFQPYVAPHGDRYVCR